MTTTATPRWETKRTQETRMVEDRLRKHFQQVDSYRYNSASIRLRIVDAKFEGKSREERDAMVEPYLDQLPESILRDIVTLLTFVPSEIEATAPTLRERLLNTEFEDPSPSKL
jgi:hypothetical protein